jgi:hypothetical protein
MDYAVNGLLTLSCVGTVSGLRTPCGGGVEYLHRDPASRRRRRKGKPQMWDSKIWSREQRDSDPRSTALARASSMSKRQTRHIVREGAPQKQNRNCQKVINIWSKAADGCFIPRQTGRLAVGRNIRLRLRYSVRKWRLALSIGPN